MCWFRCFCRIYSYRVFCKLQACFARGVHTVVFGRMVVLTLLCLAGWAHSHSCVWQDGCAHTVVSCRLGPLLLLCLAGWLCSHCRVLQVGPTLTVVFGRMGFVLQLCLVRQVYYTIALCWVCSPGCVLQDRSVHTWHGIWEHCGETNPASEGTVFTLCWHGHQWTVTCCAQGWRKGQCVCVNRVVSVLT